jgi:NADH:ubiquinone oxidoreductase subunit C
MIKAQKVKKKEVKQKLKDFKKKGARLITISDLKDSIIYHLSLDGKTINLKVKLNKEKPEIDTMTDVFLNADLYEREIMEKTRIKIKGHPNPKKLFTE